MKELYKHFENIERQDLTKLLKYLDTDGGGLDKFDLKTADNTNDYEGLVDFLKQEYGVTVPYTVMDFKGSVEETKRQEKDVIRQEEKATQDIADRFNKAIVCKNKDISKHYDRLRKSIKMTAQGYFNGLFIQGKAGIGKSYQDIATLNEIGFELEQGKNLSIEMNKEKYIIFSGDMSLAYLYRFLYEHNGKVIVFRDLTKLVSAIRSIDILKAVMETHSSRLVQKALYSKEQDDIPDSFICESHFIFEMNSLSFNNILKEDINALISRGDYVSLVFSFDEIKDIMRHIAKTDIEKAITKYLIDNYEFVGWNQFNLRTQQKAFKIYQYSIDNNLNWKDELQQFLKSEMSEIRKELYGYVGDRALRSSELKKIMVQAHISNCWNLRTADRRIREYILMRELYVVGFVCNDDDELEGYINSHKNYAVSLNPIEHINMQPTESVVYSAV